MKTLFLSLLLLSFSACADNSANPSIGDNSGAGGSGDTEVSAKMYNISFVSLWNQADHLATPRNGHFSPLVVATHTDNYALFPKGEFASRGFTAVAEFGQTGLINSEINAASSNGDIGLSLNTENQFMFRDGVIEQNFSIMVTKDHPLLSLVTMIAPSPDWVVGVSGVELHNNDGFVNEVIEMDLHAYHAGTQDGDQGGNFNLGRQNTNPVQVISRLSGNGLDAPFARLVITPVK